MFYFTTEDERLRQGDRLRKRTWPRKPRTTRLRSRIVVTLLYDDEYYLALYWSRRRKSTGRRRLTRRRVRWGRWPCDIHTNKGKQSVPGRTGQQKVCVGTDERVKPGGGGGGGIQFFSFEFIQRYSTNIMTLRVRHAKLRSNMHHLEQSCTNAENMPYIKQTLSPPE